MADGAIVAIDLRTGGVGGFVGRDGHGLWHLLFDARVEGFVGHHFFKWHSLGRCCYRRHAGIEIEVKSSRNRDHRDDDSKDERFHVHSPVVFTEPLSFELGHYIGRTAADTTRIAAGKSDLGVILLFPFLSDLPGGGACARRRRGTEQRADPLLSPRRHRDTTEESRKTQAPCAWLIV